MAIFIVNCLIGGASLRSWKAGFILMCSYWYLDLSWSLYTVHCFFLLVSLTGQAVKAGCWRPPRASRQGDFCWRYGVSAAARVASLLGLRGRFVSLGANQVFCSGGLSPAPSWPAFIQPQPLPPCSLQLAARSSQLVANGRIPQI